MGALVNSVFLVALCFTIFVEAIERLIEPERIEEADKMLYVGIAGLVINLLGLLLFHQHSHGHGHGHSHSHGHGHGSNAGHSRHSHNHAKTKNGK
jgi:solute carrier family 30 (zinc transporter), member 1